MSKFNKGIIDRILMAPDGGDGASGGSPGGQGNPGTGDNKTGEGDDSGAEEFETYNGFKVPKGAVEAINKRVAAETHTWKEKYNSLSSEINTLKTTLEEHKLSQMSEAEKKAHEEKQRQAEKDKLVKERDEKDSKFKNYYLDTELFKEVSGHDVYNANQVIRLLKAEYPQEITEGEDGLSISFNVKGQKLTVQEAVKTFLDDPNNANLLKSRLQGGGGTGGRRTGASTGRTTFKRSEVADTTSEAAKEYREAIRNGVDVRMVED